ncbi:hypothetical protein D9V67_02480 [Buchnera aphidicola (Brachycaudus cardui)]|uniref:DNA polymerase III tau subunit domain-containing protein n=1 Tax=Buchnera aphidicola (Brachycaudus cardui) TaxID=557993 RepID=A0A4D6XXK3_9GAMM|nr:DNA polymerase III subunit gamma/tau C-terminal domain-containing protein [Buchnera aphidicola]QCI20609.1 hypothetical protein D9V67_02480 [Buchnera aphidicola (Brachycaudus cardui)]
MINKTKKNKIYNKIINKNYISQETILLLQNRNELLKKRSVCKENIKIINFNKMYSRPKNFFYELNLFKDDHNLIILKKIKEIDPWYSQICKLKKISRIAEQLAINTSYKNTLGYWNIYLIDKKKYLINNNAWTILKNNLSTITKKRIKLIIKKKNILDRLTPYEWFDKIHKAKILKEYSLLIQDPNVQFLKKEFNTEFQQKNINFI